MVSRDPKISPSMGMMATLAPKTSPRDVVSSFAIDAIRTPRSSRPAKTTRQPLKAPMKKIPARDFFGVVTAAGSAMASPEGSTGSSSDMGSALRRGLRGRSRFCFGVCVMLFRRRRGRMLRDLVLGQRPHVARRQTDLLVGPVDLDHARAHRLADMKGLIELRFRIARDFRDVRQPFHAIGDADEEAKVGDLRDRANDLVANIVRLREVVPLVREELFDG